MKKSATKTAPKKGSVNSQKKGWTKAECAAAHKAGLCK